MMRLSEAFPKSATASRITSRTITTLAQLGMKW
jgi:hypothetical protein